jgi:hypothetical protein
MPNTTTIPMIIATKVMKPGRARVGKIGNNITLPRTVTIVSLLAGLGGALFGALVGIVVGPSTRSVLLGAAFGAVVGVVLVNYSPLEGESLLKWLGLTLKARRQRIYVNGQQVRLAIGICPVSRSALGPVRIQRGAVNVPSTQYDARGVLISKNNHNLHDASVSNLMADLLGGHAAPLFPGTPDAPEPPKRARRSLSGR